MLPFEIEKIYIDQEAETDWVSRDVVKSLPSVPVEIVADRKALIRQSHFAPDPLRSGKRQILITRFYGKRLKPCPGTSGHICCGYRVINANTNCPMDCSYCVLQGYLNNPFLTLYSNVDQLLQEIEQVLTESPQSLLRLGTGELSDSLALDELFPMSKVLVPFFAVKQNGILELKTKSSQIDNLLGLRHQGRTVVSWSLNPARIIEEEEVGTASLAERVRAARECQEKGYPIGFHFDPLIDHEGWEESYRHAVEAVFEEVDPKGVIWVSLGGFQYPPQLKAISRERFPETRIFLGELFPGRDGKIRYLNEIRVEMYRKMVGWLKEIDPDLFVYLCMESPEVWERVFGWSPSGTGHLNRLFEARVKEFKTGPMNS